MRLGVLGAGQLGRMLALAAAPLGVSCRFFDQDPDACAGDVGELHVGSWDDLAALDRFAQGLDAVTIEFENVPARALAYLAQRPGLRVAPVPTALEVAQDRAREKQWFERSGLAVHPWASVDSADQARAALARVGLPAILKTRRGGYDGKGQAIVRDAGEVDGAWRSLGAGAGVPAIIEALVPFEREVSIVAARGHDGAFVAFPPVQNVHRAGILRETIAPAPGLDDAIAHEATRHVRELAEGLGYVGVLAVEFFVHQGRLLANEMAPRVHNSGHWTIDACGCDQFEQHVRAVLGLPLGVPTRSAAPPAHASHAVMINFIGAVPRATDVLSLGAGVHLHLYGKEGRKGRKVGHATLVGEAARDAHTLGAVRELAARCDS